jgi:hypothetical protein
LCDFVYNNIVFIELKGNSEKLLSAASAIERQIELKTTAAENDDEAEPVDDEWLAAMRRLVETKRADAALSIDTAQLELEWSKTPEYTDWQRFEAKLARIEAKHGLLARRRAAHSAMNNGTACSMSGAAFERYVQRAGLCVVFAVASLDYAWLQRCQEENARLTLTHTAWLDQSKTAWSLSCIEQNKPNYRVLFGCKRCLCVFFSSTHVQQPFH